MRRYKHAAKVVLLVMSLSLLTQGLVALAGFALLPGDAQAQVVSYIRKFGDRVSGVYKFGSIFGAKASIRVAGTSPAAPICANDSGDQNAAVGMMSNSYTAYIGLTLPPAESVGTCGNAYPRGVTLSFLNDRMSAAGVTYQARGLATGSLPTCNAASAGSLEYDTTLTKLVGCNGATWNALW